MGQQTGPRAYRLGTAPRSRVRVEPAHLSFMGDLHGGSSVWFESNTGEFAAKQREDLALQTRMSELLESYGIRTNRCVVRRSPGRVQREVSVYTREVPNMVQLRGRRLVRKDKGYMERLAVRHRNRVMGKWSNLVGGLRVSYRRIKLDGLLSGDNKSNSDYPTLRELSGRLAEQMGGIQRVGVEDMARIGALMMVTPCAPLFRAYMTKCMGGYRGLKPIAVMNLAALVVTSGVCTVGSNSRDLVPGRSCGWRGACLTVKGHFPGNLRKRYEVFQRGSVPGGTKTAAMDVAQGIARAKEGIIGVKLVVCYGS